MHYNLSYAIILYCYTHIRISTKGAKMKRNKCLEKLVLDLLNLKPFLPGSVTKQFKTCGKPNCRCMDKENPQKHPSFQLAYTLDNKKSTVYVKKAEVEKVQKMTASYKKLQETTKAISLETVRITREYGPKVALELVQLAFDKACSEVVGGKPESGKLRDVKSSRNRWKERAIKRNKELDKNQIKIRDLIASRKNWKNQTLRLRTDIKELEKSISEQTIKISKLELKEKNSSKKN